MTPRPTTRPHDQQRGSLLIVTMLLCAIIGVSLVSYYKLAHTALKGAQRSTLTFSAMDVAEMGIEPAMACFYAVSNGTAAATAWTGWTLNTSTNEATRTFPSPTTYFSLGAGAQAQVKVYVHYYTGAGGPPIIVAKSIISPADGPPINKFVEVSLANRSLWAFGMVGKTWVHMNSNSTTDSWISDPDNNPATPAVAFSSAAKRDKGSVGTVSSANGALAMDSNADLYGTANTGGGNVTTNSNVRIHVASSPSTPKVDLSLIHKDFTFTFPAIVVPTPGYNNVVSSSFAGGSSSTPQVLPRSGDVASGGKYYYTFNSGVNINMDSNKYISITDSVVFIFPNHSGFDSIHTSSNANINVTAGKTVEIYTNGNITLDSNNNINVGNEAKNFSVYGTNPTSQTFTLSSNVTLYGTIYAPTATFRIDSNCNLYGAMITNTIQMDSNAGFHYDESLANSATGSGFRVSKWRELQTAGERSTYSSQLNF